MTAPVVIRADEGLSTIHSPYYRFFKEISFKYKNKETP